MPETRAQIVTPQSYREFARVLGRAADSGRAVRIRGAGTKLGWGWAPPRGALNLSTTGLTEHSFAESTATFGAGTPLARVHALLARRGRLLAFDPPLRGRGVQGITPGDRGATGTTLGGNDAGGATIGGAIAANDCGPLAHGYGTARAQIVDVLAALSDGTIVRGAEFDGPDLSSLLTGSYGTLGAILEVTVLTRELPRQPVTVTATVESAERMAAAAAIVADAAGVAAVALDYRWRDGRGMLLALLSGELAGADADKLCALLAAIGLGDAAIDPQGDRAWGSQRAAQRSGERAVIKVSCPRSQLPAILRIADAVSAVAVGRAALGISYLTLNVNQVAVVRAALPPGCHAVVTDLPGSARGAVDPWGPVNAHTLEMMRRIKQRLDPAGACSKGVFVGGI